jgi:hypothetical protein
VGPPDRHVEALHTLFMIYFCVEEDICFCRPTAVDIRGAALADLAGHGAEQVAFLFILYMSCHFKFRGFYVNKFIALDSESTERKVLIKRCILEAILCYGFFSWCFAVFESA